LATLRNVSTPWPQSNTSNCSAGPALAALATSGAPSGAELAVMYPPPTARNAIRSTASLLATFAPPSRSVMPSNGVTWYGIRPEYQSV
jgi:hypothetical protein